MPYDVFRGACAHGIEKTVMAGRRHGDQVGAVLFSGFPRNRLGGQWFGTDLP